MPTNFSNDYGTAKLDFVLTSSTTNGPIINFSASISVYNNGTPPPGNWVTSSRSILSFNSMQLVSQSLTGSLLNNYIASSAQLAGVNFNTIADDILVAFVSSANIANLFLSQSITLG